MHVYLHIYIYIISEFEYCRQNLSNMSDIYLAKTGVHKVLLIRFSPSFGQVPVLQPLLSCWGGGIEVLPADKSSAAGNHLQLENFNSNNCVGTDHRVHHFG